MANEKLVQGADGTLHYQYSIDDCNEVAFDFQTLAEVGEPYQQWFREEIQRLGLLVDFGRNLDARPWVADVVIGDLPTWNLAIDTAIDVIREVLRTEGSAMTYEACIEAQAALRLQRR